MPEPISETDGNIPWHHVAYYDNLKFWDDNRLIETYRRLSRDLRLSGRRDIEHIQRMVEVEWTMRERGLDPEPIAREVESEKEELFGRPSVDW